MRTGLYRPSNGTEGEGFMCRFCMECERDRAFWEEDGDGCEIAARSLIFDTDEEGYPTEWRYDEKGEPTCTAFVALGKPVPTEREQEAAGQLSILGGAS
jgi:hypothetical protein